MTEDLKARIAAAISHGLWYSQADPDSVAPETLAAVMTVVQPIVDDLAIAEQHIEEGNEETLKAYARLRRAEAERDRLRTGVEAMWTRWFANAHASLGFRQAMDGIGGDLRRVLGSGPERRGGHSGEPPVDLNNARIDGHNYVGTPTFGQRCQDGPAGSTCGGLFEQHVSREPCYHLDSKQLGARVGDLSLWCACGAQVFAGPRTMPNNPPTSSNTANNPGGQP